MAYLLFILLILCFFAFLFGFIIFIFDWDAEGDIKKTWIVKMFTSNYIEYCKLQNETVTIWDNNTRYVAWISYSDKKIKDFPTISLDQLKDFYYLNPKSWSLQDCRVVKDNNDELSFTFTYDEWKKYKKFKEQIEEEDKRKQELLANQKLEKEKTETTRKILESVQKDIDKIRAESEKEFEEVKRVVETASCEHEWEYVQNKLHESNVVVDLFVCKKCGQIKIVRSDKYDLR